MAVSKCFIMIHSFVVLTVLLGISANIEEVDTFIEERISDNPSPGRLEEQWNDFGILETEMEELPRAKRRIGERKSKKNRERSGLKEMRTDMSDIKEDQDDENYHVRYSTKFAFQNVDEFGLKVKYNKTENVYYGDNLTPDPSPLLPFEAIAKPQKPAALTFMTTNEVEKQPIKMIQLENDPKLQELEKPIGDVKPVNRVQRSLIDSNLQFPQVAKVIFGQDQGPSYAFPHHTNSDSGSGWLKFMGENGLRSQHGTRQQQAPVLAPVLGRGFGRRMLAGDSADNRRVKNTRRFSPGTQKGISSRGSRELNECRNMDFEPGENARDMTGICLMCLRNEDEFGRILYSVKGCPAVDCEEFELPNPYDPYPYCCPVCKGARRKYKEEDLMYGNSNKDDQEADDDNDSDNDEAGDDNPDSTDASENPEESERRSMNIVPNLSTKINNSTSTETTTQSAEKTNTTISTEESSTPRKRRLHPGRRTRNNESSNAEPYRRRVTKLQPNI